MKTIHNGNEAMATACHEDSNKTEVVSILDEFDPWNPPYDPRISASEDLDMNSYINMAVERMDQTKDMIANSRATHTIIPDRTPESAYDAFYDILPRLEPILEKDSVRLFLRLFEKQNGCGFAWGFVITPLAFNQIVKKNALRCAKVVLDGKAPELRGHRANPNYMNQNGFFPLHQAAEVFSVDMIKLLFNYGASANLRTTGPDVTENLLPLHVAVENTCLHKFLEDNLSLDQEKHLDCNQADADNIYKLIHLLCLPEMKIFLDTTRVLAEKTDNLVDEVWKYIEGEKIVQAAVLLLAAQKEIRGSYCKGNGTNRMNGFIFIMKHILDHTAAIDDALDQKSRGQKQLKAKRKHFSNSLILVHVIFRAGVCLDAYVQAHPKVTHALHVGHREVLDRVSSILKDHGFPCESSIDIGNLCPYEHGLPKFSSEDIADKKGNAVAGMHSLHRAPEKVGRKKQPRGWELEYTRRSFFPYWRSMLWPRMMSIVPPMPTLEQIDSVRDELSVGREFNPVPNSELNLMARFPHLRCHQPIWAFKNAAALFSIKALKNI